MVDNDVMQTIASMPCWSGAIEIAALAGGLTNRNFRVRDQTRQSFVVRLGDDKPEHGIVRLHELAAARAAFVAGIAPQVIYAADGALVSRYIDGSVLTPDRLREPGMLERIVALLRRCHLEVARYFQGPTLRFCVFQVIRGYLGLVEARGGLPAGLSAAALAARALRLEQAVGAVSLVFAHNDLLAANLIDDGERLWLIDWEYAGFNSPLFDLANLATNNELPEELEGLLLERYYGGPLAADTRRAFAAMQCASLLRETLWAVISGLASTLAFDYQRYAEDYRQRFERRWQQFERRHG